MTGQAVFMAALLLAAPAWAINKCTGADGKVVYQEVPCAGNHAAKEVKIWDNTPSAGSYGRFTPGTQMPLVALPLDVEAARKIAATDMEIAKRRLKDPDSAKFDGVRVLSFKAMGKAVEMTCGNLNAKNSYGGYVGTKPFWVYEGVFTETFDHYYAKDPTPKYLMGGIQTACLTQGIDVAP